MTILAALIVLVGAYAMCLKTLDEPQIKRRIKACEDETFKRIEGKE